MFEGPNLLDWGITRKKNGLASLPEEVAMSLISRFEPDFLLVATGNGGQRRRHGKKVAHHVKSKSQLQVQLVSSRDVRECFRKLIADRPTKQRIMNALAEFYPGLAPLVPRPRRAWDPQDYYVQMFDAVAHGFTWMKREA